MTYINRVFLGSCENMSEIPDGVVHCCVTSPPYYGLRDYGADGQIGLEATVTEYVSRLVSVFREVRRTLRDDGTLWLNIGDSYAGCGGGNYGDGLSVASEHGQHPTNVRNSSRWLSANNLKPKDLIGVPWRLAFALQADGWYLRSDIIWHKPRPMPSSVTDRPTSAHEYIFLLAKSHRYYYDQDSIREPIKVEDGLALGVPTLNGGRRGDPSSQEIRRYEEAKGANKRTVWSVNPAPYADAHFATFPPDLIAPCIKAGSPAGGLVLDPFMGSGTTAEVAESLGRLWVGYELNTEYHSLIKDRTRQAGLFTA